MSDGIEEQAGGEIALQAIPLIMAETPAAEPLPAPAPPRFTVPKIVDYLIVAAFIFFFL